jgi:hypothetical protein
MIIENDAYLMQLSCYIHRNSLRAGLVKRLADYRRSSYLVYAYELYTNELNLWFIQSFQTMTRGGMATEHVWMSYPPPNKLHDYRYLGNTFRDRERIQRKQNRWVARLKRMPELERNALLDKVSDQF